MRATVKSLMRSLIPPRFHPRLEALYTRVRYLVRFPAYRGTKFECPMCGGRFGRLLPFGSALPVLRERRVAGAGYRTHARCPRCGSNDRERLVYLFLSRKTRVFDDRMMMLHVAPEWNLQRILRAQPNIEYLSVDHDAPLAMVKMDITRMECGNDTFDAIICNHVLQDVPDDRKALSELFRVLKPGGWAILQVPLAASPTTIEDSTVSTPEARERAYGGMHHVRIYGKDFETRLNEVGFHVQRFSFASEYGADAARRYGLLMDEEVYLSTKPAP